MLGPDQSHATKVSKRAAATMKFTKLIKQFFLSDDIMERFEA